MFSRLGPASQIDNRADLSRRAFRLGIVQQQDAPNGRLRVAFAELDQMLSYWLPVVVPKTQDDKAYWMPDLGEQVVCLMDERDEAGVVLGAIYSQADSTPVQSADKFHIGFKDGTAFEYDRSSHLLELSFEDGTAIKYDAAAHVFALNFEDGTVFKYDSAQHALTIDGGAVSASVIAPAGVVLQAGSSQVSILPDGVSIVPPLPLSSTVAQT